MKTPRQILFERHRSVEPKLDAIRQSTLAGLVEKPGQERRRLTSVGLWDLIVSLRWHLAGLSAVWLAIALLGYHQSSSPPALMARGNVPPPQQFLTALRENREQLLELIEPAASGTPNAPQRRSEIYPLTRMA
jgi:hypothetical protein